ncbi:unnamed protein product [Oikopleura dioica]|uniref:Uncharacterized protein n=1 Tax=Oikopleura dioica TaxID=34765 RepID=E4WZ96_OIKDI|nr:unnamed protein product [Oikopleura dioica]
MRIVLEFLIPFGLFVAVLLTPFYLRRDSRKNEGEQIFDEQLTTTDRLFGTITYKTAVLTPRSFSSPASTTAASTTTTTVVTTKITAKTIITTNVSPKITTSTTTSLITTTTTTPISATTTTTTQAKTTIAIRTITTTSTTASTLTSTTITTTTTTTTSTTTTTTTTTAKTTTIALPPTTKASTTTTTEQNHSNPCPYECSNSENCRVIVDDKAFTPKGNTPKGNITATTQFRLNIGIDFPTNANPPKANLVHIHTGTNNEKFGDGFFAVFNPIDETNKLRVTTSNNSTTHRNSLQFTAIVGQFQCVQVEQILNSKTQKLDHKIKFNGNTILSRQYHRNDVFTGEVMVFISDQWHATANRYKVRNFIYEKLD